MWIGILIWEYYEVVVTFSYIYNITCIVGRINNKKKYFKRWIPS